MYFVQIATGLLGAGFGLYSLYKAFTTGRALDVAGFSDRATRPFMFWLSVVGLFLFVAICSMEVALPVLKAHWGFHALHSVAVSDEMAPSPVPATATPGCSAPGPAVCFVVAGAAPDVPVETLADYYTRLLGEPVGVLDPVALTRTAGGLPMVSEKRSQVGIDALTHLVHATYPELWGQGVTVIILTGNDVWFEDRPDWQYSFGAMTPRSGGGGFGVVSSARLDPAAYGEIPNAELLERRLHRMVGKYLAILRYGESMSSDPASPVYNGILSPGDLDRMQEFVPPQ